MTNRESAYQRAFEIKKENLRRKTAVYEQQIAQLFEQNTEFSVASARLSALGARIALTALSGDTEALSAMQSEIEGLNSRCKEIKALAGVEEISYDCPLCFDTGYVSGRVCECVKQLAQRLNAESLAISLPLKDSRFEDFKLEYYPTELSGNNPQKRMTGIFKLCREYALSFDSRHSENLLFMGGAGLGKTHLSLAIVSELIKKDFDVLYSSAYNLFSKMENEHFNLRSEDTYNYAISCDLLVIDDLGSEFVSPYIQTLLYNIINTRLLASRPVIISTNLTMREIEARYTARVSSRLLGHYNAKLFIGEDIRQIKAMQS